MFPVGTIKTVKQFRKQVLTQKLPCVVLLRSDKENTLEESLQERLNGQFHLCLLDEDQISDELQEGLQMFESPSILLIFRQNIAYELRGQPKDEDLDEMMRKINFYYNCILEEDQVSELLTSGQKSLVDKEWKEAIALFEQAQAIKRWPVSTQEQDELMMHSSLAYAFSQLGNLN